ncbi:MAG: hypothetical protein ACD_79C01475G0003 [uncultured bacterium]|nr:MAG: hypothetical protein ACD_79C01475G0003 [uncultured bacterium]
MLDLQGLKSKSITNHFCRSKMVLLPSNPHEIKVLPDHHNHLCQTWRPYIKAPVMPGMTEGANQIKNLIKSFQKEIVPSDNEITQKCRNRFLKFFLDFINSKGLTLKSISTESLKEYFPWLINQRNFQGIYFKPRTVVMMLCIAGKFLNWLKEKSLIKEEVLYPSDLSLTEITKIYRKRREVLQEQNINTPEESIFKTYESLIQQYRRVRFNPTGATLETIKKYLHSTGKRLKNLKLNDYETIRESLLLLESIPNRSLSLTSFIRVILYVKQFEYWLYEQGYILKRHLDNWTKPVLRNFVNRKFNEVKSLSPARGRYYSVVELMRAYKAYLKKRMKNFYLYQHIINRLNFFFQYLILQGKTIYTATETTVEEYKQYILNYEYRPNCHYQLATQIIMISNIKRFYDWLIKNKYGDHHPLKDFKNKQYKEWLKQHIKPDILPKKEDNWYDSLLNGFIKYEEYKGLSQTTINRHHKGSALFFKYLTLCGIEDIKEASREIIRNYIFYLTQLKNEKNEPLSNENQFRYIAGVKALCEYLEKYALIDGILSMAVEYPKVERGLPTPGFDNHEAKMLIESAKGDTPKSLRNRVFFELLYSSGMRSNEMCQLKLKNVDLINGMVRIDVPKGGKQYERVIPIGKTTCIWIERYIKEIRKGQPNAPYLFLNNRNEPYTTCTVLNAVKTHIMKLPLKKRRIITHSFRVSCATEMLRKGANIKIVQEQLGHKVITSTEKYLRLVPTDLKKAHTKYHPRG